MSAICLLERENLENQQDRATVRSARISIRSQLDALDSQINFIKMILHDYC